MAEYYLEFKKSKEIEAAMKKVPEKAEQQVNKVLHTVGVKETIQSIIGFMPVSNRNKKHAKFSNPLKSAAINLGFRVYARGGASKNKGSFGYLVFPNDGLGENNLIEQRFFERGGEKASDKIFKNVMDALEEAARL